MSTKKILFVGPEYYSFLNFVVDEGFEIEWAEDESQGLDRLTQEQYAVAICDLIVPTGEKEWQNIDPQIERYVISGFKVYGLDFAKKATTREDIQAKNPSINVILIGLLKSHPLTREPIEQLCLNAGAQAYINLTLHLGNQSADKIRHYTQN